MDIWKRFGVTLSLTVGLQLILLVKTSEVGGSNANLDSNDQHRSTFPHDNKYIMEPYFQKYDSLNDSHFVKFMARELDFGSCEVLSGNLNLVLQLSVLRRDVIGEGSHRHLSSTIRFKLQSEFVPELPKHFCEFIIVEKLPSGVFADPFELQHLLQRGVFLDAAVFGETNLEQPSFRTNRSLVEIHMDSGHNTLSRLKHGWEINLKLPLHARYQPLGESGYSRVEIGSPDLFMRCSMVENSQIRSCLLMMKDEDEDVESRTRSVVWTIPSGIEAHARVVSVVTFGVATLSTVLIVLSSIYYSDIRLCTNIKRS